MSNQIVVLSDGQAFNSDIYTVVTVSYDTRIGVNMSDKTCITIDTGSTRMTTILKETIQTLIDHGIPMVMFSDGQAYNKDKCIFARILYRNNNINATFMIKDSLNVNDILVVRIDPGKDPIHTMKRNLDIILDSYRKDDEEDESSSDESSSDESSSDDLELELEFDFTMPELELASEDSDEAREQLLEEMKDDELQDELLTEKEPQINDFINQTVDASVKMATSLMTTDELTIIEIEQPDSS